MRSTDNKTTGSTVLRILQIGFLALTVLATTVVVSGPGDVARAASYPYPSAPDCAETPGSMSGCVADKWNFFQGQCTSGVAWRLNTDNGVAFHNYYKNVHWGDASNWVRAAGQAGIRVDTTPARGAVAWYSNHVAYVEDVRSDGSIVLWEMNYDLHNGQRRIAIAPGTNVGQIGGWPSKFIHIKDLPASTSDYRGTILRNSGNGDAWLIKSDAKRYHIPTGGDYQAIVNNGVKVHNVTATTIDRYPNSGKTAKVIRIDEPKVYERINGKFVLVYNGGKRVGNERWIDRYTGVWYAYGRDAYFTQSAAGKSYVTDYFRWSFSPGSAGTYKVVAYTPKRVAVAGVIYRIYDGSKLIKKVGVKQQNHYGWTTIATVKSTTGKITVRIHDNEGSGPYGAKIGADLVEVVPLR